MASWSDSPLQPYQPTDGPEVGPVGTFLGELAKQLADRWLTLLLIPGAVFAAAVEIGVRLGQGHALDYSQLTAAVSGIGAMVARQSASTQAVLVAVVLLATTGAGLAVQALAGFTRLLWLGPWPRILASAQRWRVASRRRRWHQHVEQRKALELAHSHVSRTTEQQEQINTAAHQTNRIAWAQPGRPTWMGDRIHAVEQIAQQRYGLDMAFAWPRLWLVLPDNARAEITIAHAAFAAAVAIGTWAWPYLLLAALWWPSLLIAMAIGATGWARARAAIADVTTLSEAALDMHGRALAIAFGIAAADSAGPLTLSEGEQLSSLIRKGR